MEKTLKHVDELIKGGREELPLSWKYALLAVLPGLLATVGLTYIDFSTKMLAGAVLLAAYLTFAYFWNGRRFPGWSLMAAGMLASMGLTIVSGILGGLASTLVGLSANVIVLLILLFTLVAIFIFQMRGRPTSWCVWMLIVLIVACQLAVRVKYFTLFGLSWSTACDWLSISLYSAVTGLLLPVVFGLFPARKHGLLAMLFTIGMIYMGIQLLIDVNQKVSAVLENGPGLLAYKAMTPFLFTVLAPLWFLRARSSRSRLIGLLVISGVGLVFNLSVVGVSYGDLPLIIWGSFVPYTASVLLTLSLAYLLYKEKDSQSTEGRSHAQTSY
jgi:hypothetical protein